jgi:hypothetical protein
VVLKQAQAIPAAQQARPAGSVGRWPGPRDRPARSEHDPVLWLSQPAVDELTVSITDGLRLVDMWRGEG